MPKPRGDVEISSSFTWFRSNQFIVYEFELNHVNDDEISTSPRGLGIYIRLFNKEVVKT